MDCVVNWRRAIHRCAELSFEEYKTQDFICSVLSDLGVEHRRVAGTGVLAQIGDTMGDVVVLRADIDALPITETAAVDFVSENAGVMHACGHDMHAAALLGAIANLKACPPKSGGVVALFQPGEELNPGGATVVIKEGVLDKYKIKAIVGQHCSPELPVGVFGFCAGQFMASTDEIHITVVGRGGHAAQPELLRNPIWAAADFLTAARTIAPDADIKHVLAFGRVIASGATNIIPNEVIIEGTFRTFSEPWRAQCHALIKETAAQIASAHDLHIDVDIKIGYPSVFNNAALTTSAENVCRGLFGDSAAVQIPQRMTAEDFGFYTQLYPALFYRLGVGYPELGTASTADSGQCRHAGRLHTSDFCPNEDALQYGSQMLAELARKFL